jgi:hypothetical protein
MFAIKIVFLETTLILGVLYLYEYFLDSLCFVACPNYAYIDKNVYVSDGLTLPLYFCRSSYTHDVS